jgi:hypothetical protein
MRRALFALCGTLAVFGVGLAVGRSGAPVPATEPTRVARERSDESASLRGTRAGAVTAASTILYGFDLPTVLSPDRFDATIQRVAAPGSQDRVRRLFGRGIDDVRAMFADRPRVARATPVGYRVLSFNGTRASVAIWNVAIGGSSLMTPVAQWRTIILDLRLTPHGWRATGGRSLPGPSPAGTTGELAKRAEAFNPFHHAP